MGEILKVEDTFTLSRESGYARARSAAERALERMGQVEAPVTISRMSQRLILTLDKDERLLRHHGRKTLKMVD